MPHAHILYFFVRLAEKIEKSKEILKVHKDVEVLRDEIEGLQKERDENIKLHEATGKSYQESSKKEINTLKSEILENTQMLEDWQEQQRKDADTIKELRAQLASFMDERKFVDSDILGKSQFSHARRNEYFSCISSDTLHFSAPVGLGNVPIAGSRLSQIQQTGALLQGKLTSAKDFASSLKIFGSKMDVPLDLWEKLKGAPAYVSQWKLSSARHGARMAFALVKGNYRDADIRHCSKGMSPRNDHDKLNDGNALWESLAGFDNRAAKICNLDEMLDTEKVPPRPESEDTSTEANTDEEEDETSSSAEGDEDPKSPAV